jgi:hypothetical protein
VNITRLHRETAAVVQEAAESSSPVFVTQNSCVTAVLLHRTLYDRLLRAAERGASSSPGGPRSAPGGPRSAPATGSSQEAEASEDPPLVRSAGVMEDPLAVFGPLPPGTRFRTESGISVDAELAAFLMEDGDQVTPILERPWD